MKAGIDLPMAKEPAWRDQALAVFKTSMTTLADAEKLFLPLADSQFKIGDEAKEVFTWAETPKVLTAWKAELEKFPGERLTEAEFNAVQDRVKEAAGAKGKTLFQPIRVAVIGQPHGAELKILVPLLPKSSLIRRVDEALKRT
jgi:nondiscriminating glutamyl-tRNA synthetase